MAFLKWGKSGASSFSHPLGSQGILNPTLTRRGLLGGLAAAPLMVRAAIGQDAASNNDWYDLEFQISEDQSTVEVREIRVTPKIGSAAEIRCMEARWIVSARAFGPIAYFDMARPSEADIGPDSSSGRILYIRDIDYGLRFGAGGRPGYVAFAFERRTLRWQLQFQTNLWLSENGAGAIDSSGWSAFGAFSAPMADMDLARSLTALPSEYISTKRVRKTLGAMFGDLVGAISPDSGQFLVTIDQHLRWTVSGIQGARLGAFDGRVAISKLNFAWRSTTQTQGGDAKPLNPEAGDASACDVRDEAVMSAPADAKAYFSAEASAGDVALTDPDGVVKIGPADGHHIKMKPFAGAALRFDAVVGAKPEEPGKRPVVAVLAIGNGVAAVIDGNQVIADGIAGAELCLSQTRPPEAEAPIVRDVVWGLADGAGGPIGRLPAAAPMRGPGDIVTPVGRLLIDAAIRPVSREPGSEPAPGDPAETPPIEQGAAAPAFSDKATNAARSDDEELNRLFQIAEGDRIGAPDASFFVLSDRQATGRGLSGLRRIHIDVALLATNGALPDTSFSRLTFKRADLRLVYEDGLAVDELALGEYPRPNADSFVWLGLKPQPNKAIFDLSAATLACGRDYDLMKLRLRFHDLQLVYAPGPQILPRHSDSRVWIGDDGDVHDDRPILVAEFDPQHVMEEAIFRPEPPPLPDVELKSATPTFSVQTRSQILAKLAEFGAIKDEKERTDALMALRVEVRDAKIKQELLDRGSAGPYPFAELADEYKAAARRLREDLRIYVGPFALHAEAMGIARGLMKTVGPRAVTAEVLAMLARLEAQAQPGAPLDSEKKLLPVVNASGGAQIEQAELYLNALRNEMLFESMEPLYGVFRGFWRDRIVTYINFREHGLSQGDIDRRIGFDMPPDIANRPGFFVEEQRFLLEFLSTGNRNSSYGDAGLKLVKDLTTAIISGFVKFALGLAPEGVPDLMGARLSGPSRLAFRIDYEPTSGVDARDAGIGTTSGIGPARSGAGNSAIISLPFTFEALTDWSRFEPAVTRRARKLFEAGPSGILPRPGKRAANPSDQAMMRFQGFSQSPTTADERMSEIRASLKSERIANLQTGADQPYPGEPLDFETAIEIPSRLILSTAQDAVWRTNRRMPAAIYDDAPARVVEGPAASLEEGQDVTQGPSVTTSSQPRDLWSVRLETSGSSPSLRAVASPDLRPAALGGARPDDHIALPGQGAPPRGPYAPWFIGSEQLEGQTLTAAQAAEAQGTPGYVCPTPETAEPPKFRLIRWLCERAGLRKALPEENYAIFRTALDAFDRHQLVLLSSTYGLPVVGKRTLIVDGKTKEERSGGLIAQSGQIEPGEDFALLDGDDDQALHKPVPLNVKALSLTALGGSFLHETAFKPSAGADDMFGRKIFEGFSIDTLQQDIVLGRDIRTEVVYKGYLLPLGHKASFVKLTERIFLRTGSQGIKAILRQRMFLRMAEPNKLYGALGQPHGGRMWCGKLVHLVADKTPDILDPTFSPSGSDDLQESAHGRLNLGGGPGLAFWPRTDITGNGLYNFAITIDGTPTALPMVFVDNIAATTSKSLKVAVDRYNDATDGELIKRRVLKVAGRKIDYAPNSKSGEAQFETNEIRIRAHGRLLSAEGQTWAGELESSENFATNGVLEGAGQPPFYPALEAAEIRLGPVERLSGGGAGPAYVQYDGHYVRYGFPGDPTPRGLPPLEIKNSNPKEVFLNLREALAFGMGPNGDRSGGVVRPGSHIVGISRKFGPLGGDEATWLAVTRNQAPPAKPAPPPAGTPQAPGTPPDKFYQDVKGNALTLSSLAPYFNGEVPRPEVPESAKSPIKLAQGPALVPDDDTAARTAATLKQVQSYFSFDAKLLGTIRLKDLMRLLGLSVDNVPVLKEVQEFGTSALSGANKLGNEVRASVLVPMRDVVILLRGEWNALDDKLKQKQPPLPGVAPKPLSLNDIYPEIDTSLHRVETALTNALATQDAVTLIPALADVHSAGRELIRGLAILAANPVERLEEAITGKLQERINELVGGLKELDGSLKKLADFKSLFLPTAIKTAAGRITDWIFVNIAAGGSIDPAVALSDLLPIGLLLPQLRPLAGALVDEADTATKTFLDGVEKAANIFQDKVIAASRGAVKQLITDSLIAALTKDGSIDAIVRDAGAKYARAVKKAAQDNVADLKAAVASADVSFAEAATIVQETVDGYLVTLDRLATDIASKTLAELRAKYPGELEALIAGVTRLNNAIQSGKALAESETPQEMLKAGAVFAQQVLGVNVPAIKTTLNVSVRLPLINAAKAGALSILPDQSLDSVLLLEVQAVKEIKTNPALPGPLPVKDQNQQIVASNQLLHEIGTALDSLLTLAKGHELKKIRDAITAAENAHVPMSRTREFTAFVDNIEALIAGGPGSTPGGLIGDLRALYGDIVDVLVATRGLGKAVDDISVTPGQEIDDRGIAEKIGKLTKEIRRLGTEIGERAGAIFERLAEFVRVNEKAIVDGAVIASAVTILDASLSNLNLGPTKQALADAEASVTGTLVQVVAFALKVVGTSVMGASATIGPMREGVAGMAAAAARLGLSLAPESNSLDQSLKALGDRLDQFETARFEEPKPKTLKALLEAKIILGPPSASPVPTRTVRQLFLKSDTAEYSKVQDEVRNFETAILREWRALQERIEGAPAALQKVAEEALAGTGVFQSLETGYDSLIEKRNQLLEQATQLDAFAPFARHALLVPPLQGLAVTEDFDLSTCSVDNLDISNSVLVDCDRLAQERMVLTDAKNLAALSEDARIQLRRRLVVFFGNWRDGEAAPLVIIAQAQDMAKDILRGDVLAAIDLGAFRDQIEDAIAGLIPTKVRFSYDFNSRVDKASDKDAIFQPKVGAEFGIEVRASVDLLTQNSDFSATAHIGPFDIYLIGGIVDALRLKFGGAAFTVQNNASPRFDVVYDDFEIGKDLEFAQQLQSYLSPKEGSGVFVQPMTRGAGIEAGYSLYLGTIGVGATSFFNVSLNVSAELPFGDGESLFKISLGRKLAPFSMGVFPFVGSGYFSIYAAADGVRGFEASFEYGGGAAIGYGPFSAECRIQVGVFVRILEVDGEKTTEIYGTFFAGGSASIWIFHFATALYVRLGTAPGGAMYGEAIYSFSFSLGIADYDYSITATKEEKPVGTGASSSNQSESRSAFRSKRPLRALFAQNDPPEADDPGQHFVSVEAADQFGDWDKYASYFATDLIEGLMT